MARLIKRRRVPARPWYVPTTAARCRQSAQEGSGAAEEIRLADLHSGLTQDVVGRGAVEIDIRRREGRQVLQATLEFEGALGKLQGDGTLGGALELPRLDLRQPGGASLGIVRGDLYLLG